MHKNSVTDQILGAGTLDKLVEEGTVTPDEDVRKITDTPEEPAEGPATLTPRLRQERIADAKLRVALATADRMHAPKPTGVHFVSGTNGQGLRQVQMIYDDGSVRNPYRTGKLSGRQKRKMRKQANRNLRAQGVKTDLRLVFKGRQADPQEVTRQTEPTGTN